MESHASSTKKWKQVARVAGLALAVFTLMVLQLEAGNTVLAESTRITFPSTAAAGAALVRAAKDDNEAALAEILGIDSKLLLGTGDNDTHKVAFMAFVSKYEKMNRWVDMSDGSRVLYIGADNFAFPVPLAKNDSGQWYFDSVAGSEEIRARDIGRNELLTMDTCSALAGAQQVYFAISGDPATYAERIISTPGRQDGLYWPAAEKRVASPLANLSEFAGSPLAKLSPGAPLVIDGYTLRILTAQGEDAPGGARSYMVNGKLTGGFAILAAPIKYAETGIMTFMAGSDGAIYERDLGPETVKIAASIQKFNPTNDWAQVRIR